MITVLQGNCLDILPTLEAESVQCCVTSPPYWGLRDYGTASWEGGDVGCDHSPFIGKNRPELNQGGCSTWSTRDATPKQCHCGARRIDAQLGLEPAPTEYLANMVRVFREVWRVLKNDGTLWVNMGDSYAANRTYQVTDNKHIDVGNNGSSKVPPGLKPKDLCMMPARLAIALCDDGWYLRSEIVWHKPNPMPESVTDRPTKAHEMVYLLSKRPTYFYDADAIREPDLGIQGGRQRDVLNGTRKYVNSDNKINNVGNGNSGIDCQSYTGKRNKRTVWTVATQPYKESHFATFPEDLIKPMILAGSRRGDTVLDPFAGSGTVGQVALGMGRKSVLIELNPKYCEMINDRTNVTVGMF